MRTTGTALLVLGLLAASWCIGDEVKKTEPKYTIDKATTYVTGPLDKDGYIDYEAALNRRLGEGIKPETNAKVLLWKVLGPKPEGGVMPAGYFKALGIPAPPEEGRYFIGLARYMKDHLKLDTDESQATLDQQSRASMRLWSAKDYPHIAGWVNVNEKQLALVIEASKRRDYFNPLVSTKTNNRSAGLISALLPSVQKCREISTALTARALLRVGEGKTDEAWQDLLACHRLGRLVARGGSLIEMLVGIALNQIAINAELAFLGSGKLTTKQIRACLQDLQKLPPMPSLPDKIDLAERFMYLDSVRLIRQQGTGIFAGIFGGPARKPDAKELAALDAIDWTSIMRNGNRWFNRLSAAQRIKDRADREKAFTKIDEDLKALKKDGEDPENLAKILLTKEGAGKVVTERIGNTLIGLMIPATSKMQQSIERIEQVHRNQHVAFALAAYHSENGRYPEKLAELAPGYLAEIPGDLFSGKVLIYRPGKDGYLLYSVGPNGKDDGGRWHDDDPRGDDPRVRMPLPELKQR